MNLSKTTGGKQYMIEWWEADVDIWEGGEGVMVRG